MKQRCIVPSMLVMAALISVVASAQQDPVEFSRHADKVVEENFPDRECEPTKDGSALECGDVVLGLDNLRRKIAEVGAEGAVADAMILQFFGLAMAESIQRRQEAGQQSPVADASTWEAASKRLRPQLVPADYRKQHKGLLTDEFLPGIEVAWVLDEPDRYIFVLKHHLKQWKISRQQLEQQALANLSAASSQLKFEAEAPEDTDLPGRWLAIAEGDGYDAARYLVPEIRRKISELLGETFFVAFPNRDFLVAWSRDYAYHLSFVGRVEEDFQNRHHPLSPEIYVGSAEGVREAGLEDHLTAIRIDWGDD